jgi:23S rRNA A2030 N6-methylase RlmJ
MAENKTQKSKESVSKFLAAVEDEEKRKDGKTLLKIFTELSKEKAAMWGDSIVGFGDYHYQSEKTKRGGEWFFGGFSPRKQALTVYLMAGVKNYPKLLEKLGKHKLSGGSCLYINKLSDIDIDVLKELIVVSFADMKAKHG